MAQVKEVVRKQVNAGDGTAIKKVSPLARFIADPSKEFNGKSAFAAQFTELFCFENESEIPKQRKVYLADFPGDNALKKFTDESNEGDVLLIEKLPVKNGGFANGVNRNEPVPDMDAYVEEIKEKKLSVYSCYIPFITLSPLSVSLVIADTINGKVTEGCVYNDKKDNISLLFCEMDNMAADGVWMGPEALAEVIESAGSFKRKIKKAAIAAGPSCNKLKWKEEAAKRGADIYITVNLCEREEVTPAEYKANFKSTDSGSLPCFNVSLDEAGHTLRKQLKKKWLEDHFGVTLVLLP
jgi:hypothetical protein